VQYRLRPSLRSGLSIRAPPPVVVVCVRHGQLLEQQDLRALAEAAEVAGAGDGARHMLALLSVFKRVE
tara:strand:- start:2202 stop:2405 length:204 start_codon:yes stop_codon:yes gene_type:complete